MWGSGKLRRAVHAHVLRGLDRGEKLAPRCRHTTGAGARILIGQVVERCYPKTTVEPDPLGRNLYPVLATRLSKVGREFRDKGGDPVHPLPSAIRNPG